MGKRKERRLAALSNAGRRVKLDLFAEPSGDLGGSNVHDDVVGDTDSKHRDGLPNSPSSSGQQPQNPLLLLGQYSDDEVDEGLSQGPHDAKVDSPVLNEEAKVSVEDSSTGLGIYVSEDLVAQTDGQQQTVQNCTSFGVEGLDKTESDATADLQKEMVSKDQTSVSGTSDERVIADVSLGWKMVMHEESKRYYYWNIETGETSWEVPHGLAQTADLACDQTTLACVNDNLHSAAVGVDNSKMPSAAVQDSLAPLITDGSIRTPVISNGVYGHGCQTDGWDGEYTNEFLGGGKQSSDVNGNELGSNDGFLSGTYGADNLFFPKPGVEEQVDINFPSRLVQQSELLLERLKSLEKSKGNLQGQDSLSKHILEIEIRLSDFRSLASYGSSLLPFWVYSDRRIKQLESVINDLLWTAKSAQDEVEDKHAHLPEGLGGQQKGIGCESEVDASESKGNFVSSEFSNSSQVDVSSLGPKDICNSPPMNAEDVPSTTSPSSHLETGVGYTKQVDATIPPEESTHAHGSNAGEDVDMDVDMEVDDMNTSGNTSVQTDQPMQVNLSADHHLLLSEDEFVVPPPPDDEWIPPPPPDNEQVPPPPLPPDNEQVPPPPPPDNELVPAPPPDDPSGTSYPALPSYPETGQSLSYPDYNLAYPGASSEYYGHVATDPGASSEYYEHAEGSQIAMPPAQLYYSAVPITYGESSQVIINSAEPVAYYELQDGTGTRSIHNIKNNFSDVMGGTDSASIDVPSTSASIQEPATVSANEGVSLASAATASAAGSSASSSVAKVQNKVVRSRKRAVAVGSSLKSNKKVSSLVDKWKAAKEELLEEEEEPESVYEILERKRQREIEEWHAKQIASGEAKDNANFQPLGGDWRERVKRKRAKVASESIDTPQDTVEGNQQPDLIELSKGLPSGWQAYWDDSSKQVYYGNAITSETTWTRPTK